MNKQDILKLLHEQIPTSAFMQVAVRAVESDHVTLSCPLTPNHNHLGTAFGGSLATMMILAAYSQTYRLIQGQGHVLIKASETKYLRPVDQEIVAVAFSPPQQLKEVFCQNFKRKGKAQIELQALIKLANGQTACTMKAQMVAITKHELDGESSPPN